MKSSLIKVFSGTLLIIYAMMIFQNEFVQGIHLIAHTSELFSSHFTFHHHGDGKSHIHHHHGFLDTVKAVFKENMDQNEQNRHQHISISETSSKLHLPGSVLSSFDPVAEIAIWPLSLINNLSSIDLDVLVPPPKKIPFPV